MTPWRLPGHVRVDPEGIWWSGVGAERTIGPGQAVPLGQFTRLGGASVERINEFTEQWGVLGLCGHGYPATHAASVETTQSGC